MRGDEEVEEVEVGRRSDLWDRMRSWGRFEVGEWREEAASTERVVASSL